MKSEDYRDLVLDDVVEQDGKVEVVGMQITQMYNVGLNLVDPLD